MILVFNTFKQRARRFKFSIIGLIFMAKKSCGIRNLAHGIIFKDIDLADEVNAYPRLADIIDLLNKYKVSDEDIEKIIEYVDDYGTSKGCD